MENEKLHGYKLATKSKRFIALLIESLIILLLISVLVLLLGGSLSDISDTSTSSFLGEVLASAIIGAIFGAVFYPNFTGNIGHKIFNLKVVYLETGKDFNKAKDGAIRESLKAVSNILIIPSFWILLDKKNQNLYDKVTKTIVVERNNQKFLG
ncbi:RDD family protein [Tenacibaculum dicentrarchi]|nr:RDD family protein [Tenacibaculum dicentrarchi]MDB0616090.1 RDD family protein [Tenacibaculum dicentrarchi]